MCAVFAENTFCELQRFLDIELEWHPYIIEIGIFEPGDYAVMIFL
jgi:hypothetical protein